jgi:hypothetical protein
MKRIVIVGAALALCLAFAVSIASADQMAIIFRDGTRQFIDLSTISHIEYVTGAPSSMGAPSLFMPGQPYRITAKHSGKCLDVTGPSQNNGATIYQWDCHGGDNQAWNLLPVGGGYYKVVAKHSGKCMDVAGVDMNNGANIHQWECHGGDNQSWRITQRPDGFFTIAAKHSGRCVDIAGAGRGNADNAQQYDCHGGENQAWRIIP